ncbi:MAG: ATP-grasp domain-containing protein [Candidatus Helarchaeota archaeon]
MILIVSFNARMIASLARKLGISFGIVDFWGDQDLFRLSEHVYTIFKPEYKSYAKFPDSRENEEKLVELALEVIAEEDITGVLIGSGLDDRPDLWNKLDEAAPILGSKPNLVRKARDLPLVQQLLTRQGSKFPLTLGGESYSDIGEFADKIGYPLVIKPKKTLGGVGIALIQNEQELQEFWERSPHELRNYYFQEYIQGSDISTTVVGDGERYKILSINEQLIGTESSGTIARFKYCGNIVPFNCTSEIAENLRIVSEKISKALKLSGIFGIDFVLRGETPHFMEINPRFPGTIELIEMVTNLNAVEVHLNAVKGKIPAEPIKYSGYAMKQTLFAKKQIVTPNLMNSSHVSDIPAPNIVLNKDDPICTVQLYNESRGSLIKAMETYVNEIYLRL